MRKQSQNLEQGDCIRFEGEWVKVTSEVARNQQNGTTTYHFDYEPEEDPDPPHFGSIPHGVPVKVKS